MTSQVSSIPAHDVDGNRSVDPNQCDRCQYSITQDLPHLDRVSFIRCTVNQLRKAGEIGCGICSLLSDAVFTAFADEVANFNEDMIVRVDIYAERGEPAEISMSRDQPGWDDTFGLFRFITNGGETKDTMHQQPFQIMESFWPDENPSNTSAMDTAQSWIEDCTRNHVHCSLGTQTTLPKRFLQLTDTHAVLQDNVDQQMNGRYACLSHCWGPNGPSITLTNSTECHLRSGVEIEKLPKTFRETAKVCIELNIQYLWIDAICIFQDDQRDWEDAALTMADIYQDAFVTIIALCATSSNDGLHPRRTGYPNSKPLQNSEFFVRRYPYEEECFRHDELKIGYWPLNGRAWAMQERLVSRKKLLFAASQIYWECGEKRRMQHEPEKALAPPFPRARPRNDLVQNWHLIVTNYASMELTFESDRLPAIAALAKKSKSIRGSDEYFAGMWKNSLLADLAWWSTCEAGRSPVASHLPSWSWISYGRLEYWSALEMCSRSQIIDLVYTPIEPRGIGHIKDAVLTLRGPTFSIVITPFIGNNAVPSVYYVESLSSPLYVNELHKEVGHAGQWFRLDVKYDGNPYEASRHIKSEKYKAVVLIDQFLDMAFALLLEEVTNNRFKRVGCIHISSVDSDTLGNIEAVSEAIAALPDEEVEIV